MENNSTLTGTQQEPKMVGTPNNETIDSYALILSILPILNGLSISEAQGILKGVELLLLDHIPIQLQFEV